MRLLLTAAPSPKNLITLMSEGNKCDYYRVMAVVECVFLALWPLVYTPDGGWGVRVLK